MSETALSEDQARSEATEAARATADEGQTALRQANHGEKAVLDQFFPSGNNSAVLTHPTHPAYVEPEPDPEWSLEREERQDGHRSSQEFNAAVEAARQASAERGYYHPEPTEYLDMTDPEQVQTFIARTVAEELGFDPAAVEQQQPTPDEDAAHVSAVMDTLDQKEREQAELNDLAAVLYDEGTEQAEKALVSVIADHGRRAGMGSPENVELIYATAEGLYAEWYQDQRREGFTAAEIDEVMQSELGYQLAAQIIERAIPLAKNAHIQRNAIQRI